MLTSEGLIYVTADLAGIGGRLKSRPEDFIVEEIPRHPPTGSGDYLYVAVTKYRRLTTDVVRLFSRHFSLPWEAIGYAGLKDKHAVTTQYYTVEGGTIERAKQFTDTHITILWCDYTDQALKRGELAGNRFDIKLRDVRASDAPAARRIIERLYATGVPNYIGEQRFGYRNDNHLQGRLLLKSDWQGFLDLFLGTPAQDKHEVNQEARLRYEAGDYMGALELWPTVHRFERQALGPLARGAPAEDAVNAIDRPHRELLISAFQSAIFNDVLDARVRAGRLHVIEPGDVVFEHHTRFQYLALDPSLIQPACEAKQVSATGPMWGRRMKWAGGEVARREREALLATGLNEQDLDSGLYAPFGSRRPLRMTLSDPKVSGGADDLGPYVRLSFQLPRGSFATTVMREVMKT